MNSRASPIGGGSTRSLPDGPANVREGGFEPPRPFGHRILSPARLPGSATLAIRKAAYPEGRRRQSRSIEFVLQHACQARGEGGAARLTATARC